jgi:hypothetical protein
MVRPNVSEAKRTWMREKLQLRLNGTLDDIRIQPSRMSDVAIHPLFALENFAGGDFVPTAGIYDEIKLALHLATLLITHEAFLEWWIHVRFARRRRHPITGQPVLDAPASRIPANAVEIVKQDLLHLASELKFIWLDNLNKDEDGDTEMTYNHVAGITLTALRFLVRDMQQGMVPEVHLRSRVNGEVWSWENHTPEAWAWKSHTPVIGLCADYFVAALESTHNPLVQHIARKNIWLSLTHTVLYEVAHVWYSCFYASARGAWGDDEVWNGDFANDEALVFLHDPLPEVGMSWENFWLGASIHGSSSSSKLTLHQHLRMITWAAAKYEEGSGYWIEAILPHVFVEQWFLKDTWTNMSALRANGGLHAPSTDTDVSVVRMGRFIVGKSLYLWLVDG